MPHAGPVSPATQPQCTTSSSTCVIRSRPSGFRREPDPALPVDDRNRMIAEGAGHFRQPGLVERLARRFSGLPMSPALRVRLKRLYVAALTLRSGGRGLSASLPGGEVIRVLPEHAHLSWNPDEYRSFREVVRPGMTALDIGANVGAYSLLLGQWVGPAGAVYAFEPSPRVFDGLVRHIELNHLAGVVHPVRAAVGGTSATL